MKKVFTVIIVMMFYVCALAESATASLTEMYSGAELLMAQGDYFGAAEVFDNMGAFSDASQMAMYCKAIGSAETLGLFDIAIDAFDKLGDFKDSKQMSAYYKARSYEAEADSYDLEKATDKELDLIQLRYEQAQDGYASLALFKDCINRYADCGEKYDNISMIIKARAADKTEAIYQQALSYENSKEYKKAIDTFETIKKYKDSETRIKDNTYKMALTYENNGQYKDAIKVFKSIIDYKDSKDRINICENAIKENIYRTALQYEENEEYTKAIELFSTISEYEDSKTHIELCTIGMYEPIYQKAVKYQKKKQYDKAVKQYRKIPEYKDSTERIEKCLKKWKSVMKLISTRTETNDYSNWGKGETSQSIRDEEYEYDDKGYLIKGTITFKSIHGKATTKVDYKVSEDGKLLSSEKTDGDGTTISKYDKKGNVTKKDNTYYLDDGTRQTITWVYKYNNNNDIVKEKFYRDGKLEQWNEYKYTYNADGSVIRTGVFFFSQEKNRSYNDEKVEITFEYDDMGLLIHKREKCLEPDYYDSGTDIDVYYTYKRF